MSVENISDARKRKKDKQDDPLVRFFQLSAVYMITYMRLLNGVSLNGRVELTQALARLTIKAGKGFKIPNTYGINLVGEISQLCHNEKVKKMPIDWLNDLLQSPEDSAAWGYDLYIATSMQSFIHLTINKKEIANVRPDTYGRPEKKS